MVFVRLSCYNNFTIHNHFMSTISAVIITKNEEKNIERCLNSLDGVVDEIILFDSQSEDRTLEIAERFGVKVFQCEWKGYAKTKNEANKKVSNDYVLWLDADEALSEELRSSIAREKELLVGAYTIARRNNYCGTWLMHGGYYPDRKIRLFPKGKGFWQGDFVHEALNVEDGIEVKNLEGDILHYSYYTTAEHAERIDKYASLGAERVKENLNSINLFKLIFSPPFRFLKSYILQLGFLDGKAGFNCTALTTKEVFLKYKKALFS